MRLTQLIIAAAAVAAPIAAHAAVVAADSYVTGAGGYVAGNSLASQYGTLPTSGFQGFNVTGGGSGTAQYQIQSGGLVNSLINANATGSGKIGYLNPATTTLTRSTARNLNTPVPVSTTYYTSLLANLGTWSGTAPAAARSNLVSFGNATVPTAAGTAAAMTGLAIGFAQDGTAALNTTGGSLVIRYNTGVGNIIADQVVVDGSVSSIQNVGTYLIVAKIDNVGGGPNTVTWWVNPTDATSDATLSSSALATGTFVGAVASANTSFARLNYYSQGWGNSSQSSVFFDEPRLATDLTGLIPEPSALGLVALAGLGLRRRR